MSAWAGLWNNVSVPAGKMEVPPSWHIWLWTLLACVRRVRSIAEACGVSFLVQKMFCLSGDKKTTEKNPDFGCQSSLLSHAFYAGTREGVLAIPLLRCSLRQGRALTCPGLFLVEVSLSLHTQQCVFVFSEALSQSVRCRIEVCVTRSRQGELVMRPSSNRNVSLDAFVRKNYDPDLSIQSLQLLSLY